MKNFNWEITNDDLRIYAKRLGSDCPFFIENQPVIAKGTGTEFQSIAIDLEGYYIYLVHPDIHISTAEAYANINPQKNENPLKKSLRVSQ